MGKRSARLGRLSIFRVTACFRLCSGPFGSKPNCNSIRNVQKIELLGNYGNDFSSDTAKSVPETGNKIMVVVDSSFEAKGALDWTLSHAVLDKDTVILLHVAKRSKQSAESNLKAYELLLSMINTCQMRRPGVQVEIALVEGEEKGPIIVKEAKKQKSSLLVLGQRKRPSFWCLMNKWKARKRRSNQGIVDYCIQNSPCLTIAVRRKSKKLGGYLITTKHHKNFWLLA